MTRLGTFTIAIAVLSLMAVPAMAAGNVPGGGGLLPLPNPQLQMQRQMNTVPVERGPHPMTYSEQVAQSLGVRNGRVDLIAPQTSSPYAPSLSVGGGMLRLRWAQ
jgi:hypothetical protein